jgi:hypothetical protein
MRQSIGLGSTITKPSEIVYLRNGINDINIDGVLFIGANNWYDWKSNQLHSRNMQHDFWKQYMNDAKTIRFDSNGYPDKMAARQTNRLIERVAEAQQQDNVDEIVIITHTIPQRSLCLPDTHEWGYLNGSYVNTMAKNIIDVDINHKIKLWVYGHTHFCNDQYIDGIRYVNNARGYYAHNSMKKESTFDGIIQLDTTDNPVLSAFGEIDK